MAQKRLKKGKKRQNIKKSGQKCTKFKNILKRTGDCMQLSHTINC